MKLPELDLAKDWIDKSNPTLWRYAALLPPKPQYRITLGEGFTPILALEKHLLLKDEGRNPTGTFKARGLALSISMAKQFGINHVALATAGNAGGAAALYAAAAGITATVYMPESAPRLNHDEVRISGAELVLVKGNIADAGERMKQLLQANPEIFSLSTMKEPYRVEGKKTMGYEIWEQLGRLPDTIIYPTGGGTGLVGIWKAFHELKELGLVNDIPTRMIAVQSSGCAPIVKAWRRGDAEAEPWSNPQTIATGLQVPHAFGDYLILRVLRESKGAAVEVPDTAIKQAMQDLGRAGIMACPEGAATLAGYQRLLRNGTISADEETLLIMTGSGYKYPSIELKHS